MIVKTVETFNTLDVPDIVSPFTGQELSPQDKLRDDLQSIASKIVGICSIKINSYGEDIDLKELKDVATMALNVQKAFFDTKTTAIQINNTQNNISADSLVMFKDSLRTEI